ncbi:MAG TPA: carbohydrate ABC transporter permease [Candidatus Cloacimonas acidaminovorans]|jgi:ABC-type glycerol-3-phosphate transport system permease component|nr:carbohydrate ABC transporter permease [Candidatus Cloacimonas sp.]NLM91112.1 carbohydrate ABC transporter permease [Candidatus Cloacimonadota bacterium]HNV63008.1 carbohydrate ABC transporter permease [Candidatus Cloacimonas acidaminovorans]HNZ89134.1 carbohydrate ABC transporter permease [Candidatus Cloacimonas acidaminovorans]HOI02102.1 carbohydrate ABC transporter permease [Candidatus Cloacimonas acidaminovorans]
MPEKIRMTIIYTVLTICGLAMIIPFIWMLSTSLMTQSEFNKQESTFIPKESYYVWDNGTQKQKIILVQEKGNTSIIHILNKEDKIIEEYKEVPSSQIKMIKKVPSFHWQNYVKAFNKVPFIIYFKNTLVVSFLTLIGVLITSTLAAYAFARMEFLGRDFLFYLFLSMMMVPEPIYLVSSYVLLDKISWLDTYQALIVPWCVNIFTIFLFRQHFKSLPQELFDAAAIDGCSTFGMLWRIMLPLSKSVIATASIFSLIGSWNSFMWPLVMTNRPELRVLQVGLSYFNQEASTQTTLLMAASTFSIVPILILFFMAQKQIIASYAKAGLKD